MTPTHWHLRSDSSPEMTACGLEMTARRGLGLPACGDCIAKRLGPLIAAPPRVHAREKYGDPKLRRKR